MPSRYPCQIVVALCCAALFSMALSGCKDSNACETDDECFSGEYCFEGRCAPAASNGQGDTGSSDSSSSDTGSTDIGSNDTGTTDTGSTDTDDPADTNTELDSNQPDTDEEDSTSGVDVSAIAAGGLHTCALLSSGEVICWGNNGEGELGNADDQGTTEDEPVFVTGLVNATELEGGHLHTCALKSDDTLWCWGSNGSEEITTDSTTSTYAAPQSVGLNQVEHFAAGDRFTCASLAGSGVDCWGSKNGWTAQPQSLTGTSDITAGFAHACAIVSGGSLLLGQG